MAQPEDAVASAAIKTKLNTRLWPSRDAEGFRKQILIVSRYGASVPSLLWLLLWPGHSLDQNCQ